MSSGCDICVDPSCGGKKNCNCETCGRKDACYRYAGLKPTIRITRRCTQSCAHCCFSCDPLAGSDMTLETAAAITQFCQANNIRRAEAMGGEFFTHPIWDQILHTLIRDLRQVRLVSNGDWAGSSTTGRRVIEFLSQHPQVHVGISKDRWHTNKHVDAAVQMLTDAGVLHRVPTKDQTQEESLVPVGRHRFEWSGFYSSFASYCQQPERRYSFLIDETGQIHKCGFGSWPYANVSEYLDGGFNARFKEFNTVFYDAFIPNCATCQRAEDHAKRQKATPTLAHQS